MNSIQGILIACSVTAAILCSIIFRTKLAIRLLAIILCATAIVFVLVPDLTTVIARRLGVGRGTDLLLYVSLIAGVHVVLHLYRRTRELERRITEQIRASALRDAEEFGRSH